MPKTIFGTPYCPNCKSKNITISDTGRSYSVSKRIAMDLNKANSKKKESTCLCNECGKIWKEIL